MTTNGGSTKDKVGSVSKSGSGSLAGGGPGQSLAAPSDKTGVTGTSQLSKAASGSAPSAGTKNFDVMAPLTFPTASASLSAPAGASGAAVPDTAVPPSAIDTTVTPGASDVMTALASQVGQAASRPPALSNNFSSLAARAGSKRSLIGGA